MPTTDNKTKTATKPQNSSDKTGGSKQVKPSGEGAEKGVMNSLNQSFQTGGEMSILLAFIKDARQHMDTVIASYKERLKLEREKRQHNSVDADKESVDNLKTVKVSDSTQSTTAKESEKVSKTLTTDDKNITSAKQETKVDSNRPSYIKGSFTPLVKPMGVMGNVTRERDFRQNPATNIRNSNSKFNPNSNRVGSNFANRQGSGTVRPNGPQRPSLRPSLGGRVAPDIVAPTKDRSKTYEKKKDYNTKNDQNKSSKRTLMRMGIIQLDDERMGSRKLKNKKTKEVVKVAPQKIEKAIITTDNLTVKILSEKIGKPAKDIIKQLMVLGFMCNINSVVPFDAMELVANEFDIVLEKRVEKSKENLLIDIHDDTVDSEESLTSRPPVVAVMGHVDHGKTSLLDTIRSTSVAVGEAGGITQHIGAYSVTSNGRLITFLDTPGHEAFTQMRARGAQVTDIAILVVAADDGVMPQTIEAINHVKAANVPMIVAINKMDKPGANPQRIKEMLTEHGVVTSEWGGDTVMVPISAKKNEGIDKLLEEISFLADYQNLRTNHNRSARGSVIEAKLDKGKGPVATILVQNGTLRVGDTVVSGLTYGRLRAMTDFMGKSVKVATASMAVAVLGLQDVPTAGDGIFVVADEKLAKQVVSERNDKNRAEQIHNNTKATIDDVFDKISKTLIKDLNIIIKADVQGSAEALKHSLLRLSNEEVRINVVSSGVGNINKSDLMLAEVSKSIIIGFGVKPDAESKLMADRNKIDIRLYNIIYSAIDDITRVMKGMEKPVYREIAVGKAQVRNVFKLSSSGTIAGCYVMSGKVVRHSYARVIRGKDIIFEGKITSLKRFKEDVREVGNTFECGIGIEGFADFAILDEIDVYNLEQTNKVE